MATLKDVYQKFGEAAEAPSFSKQSWEPYF